MVGAVTLSTAMTFAGCGGGGGSDDANEPSPPTDSSTPGVAIVSTAGIVVTASTPAEIRSDQQCSLIEAIINANNDASTHADCAPGNGADVIVLPASSAQLLTTTNNSVYGPTGLPVITSTLTIEGKGSSITRDSSAPSFRIFAVTKDAELHLRNTTISGGASVRYGDPSQGGGIGYGDPSQGGGILNYGTLDVYNSKISDNTSALGGGGIHSEGGSLVIRDSILSGNMAEGAGGAISQVRNSGTLINNDCSGNTALLDGGCMWVGATSIVTVTDSTIRNNFGKAGGGLRAEWNSVLVVSNSTVSDNRAWGRGGGISNGAHATALVLNSTIANNASEYYGGGVLSAGSLTFVKDSTVSGNSAPRGGGIATGSSGTNGGTIMVMSSTIAFNQASESGGGVISLTSRPLILSHALIVGNTAVNQPSEVYDSAGTVMANAFNLFGYGGNAAVVGLQPGASDIVGPGAIDVILDAELRNNGGPTDTHALNVGSPAINSGDPRASTMEQGGEWMYDQRGPDFLRFDGVSGTVDIGAFEAQ